MREWAVAPGHRTRRTSRIPRQVHSFGLGQLGSRLLELAGGSRELTFALVCALVLGLIQAASETTGRDGPTLRIRGLSRLIWNRTNVTRAGPLLI